MKNERIEITRIKRLNADKKLRESFGFTMAELLIVVAIIGVLSAVTFIAVQNHQKNLNQLEMDAVAKEIFVAAQNHLLMAENENYLGSTEYGKPLDATNNPDDIYYFTVNRGIGFTQNYSLLDQMLPFGSIDETVRVGGYYIVYYQPKSSSVLDVFYTDKDYTFTADTRAKFGGKEYKDARKNNSPMLGWYGGYGSEEAGGTGVAAIAQGQPLIEPTIVVENAEKLRVTVTDPNYENTENGRCLVLIVSGLDLEGNETGAKKAIKLYMSEGLPDSELLETPYNNDGIYKIILDDITSKGLHFADIQADTVAVDFVPGQNVSIQAVAYNTDLRTNIAKSDAETTNSLFGSINVDEDGVITASINNIRHLENLEENISGLDTSLTIGTDTFVLQNAVQTSDISWKTFATNIAANTAALTIDTVPVWTYGNDATSTTGGYYMPISPDYLLSYDGKNYNVSDIKVSYVGDSGLFGTITGNEEDTEVKNIALIDFNIKSTSGNAGALAGSMTKMSVTNVVAYNTVGYNITKDLGTTIEGVESVGGLIGKATTCTVSKAASALVVSSKDGNAGGLIGTCSDGSVSASYSGGHTRNADYSETIYNVTGNTNSGGLIGDAGDTEIKDSYSTCSVKGNTTGGFVGSSSGEIGNSYCTGKVNGTIQGAFAGELSDDASISEDCYYFEIINGQKDTDVGYKYMTAIGNEGTNVKIQPLDADNVDDTALNSYNIFADHEKWTDAGAYDPKLIEYYGGKYNLPNVVKLGYTDVIATDFVATHYGDWPAPEIFVVNE